MKPATAIVNPYAKKPPPPSAASNNSAAANSNNTKSGVSSSSNSRQSSRPPSSSSTVASALGNTDALLAGKRIVVHAASFSQAFESIEVPNHHNNNSTTNTSTSTYNAQQTNHHLDGIGLNQAAQDNINAIMMTSSQTEGSGTAAGTAAAGTAAATSDRDSHVLLQQPHVLYVSTKQRGNGLLQYIRNVPYAYSRMIPDYVISSTQCALFLSIKYHSLYPNYIYRRISELKQDFTCRILLCLIDVQDNAHIIRLLNKIAVINNLTLILAWSEEEAARYLETFKVFHGRDATLIQRKESTHFVDQVTDFLSACTYNHRTVVNKTDAATLLSQFNTVRAMTTASMDELGLVTGMGQVKVKRLYDAFHKPFSKKRSKQRKKQKQQQQQQADNILVSKDNNEKNDNDNNSAIGQEEEQEETKETGSANKMN